MALTTVERAELVKALRTAWLNDLRETLAAGLVGAHNLSGTLHVGALSDDQAPQFLLATGTRQLTGDLGVAAGIKVDGVDLSAHAHSGADGSVQIGHGSLIGVSADQHHAGFVALLDNANSVVSPNASDQIKLSAGNGVYTAAGVSLLTIGLITPTVNLSATSINEASGTGHTHAIDAASDLKASHGALLKGDGSGGIDLHRLGIANVGVAGDLLTVGGGAGILVVNQHADNTGHVGINCAPDPQFDLDVGGNLRAQGWIVGKHAIQISNAVLIAHYDGWLPNVDEQETEFTGSPTGHMGQVATVTGDVIYRRSTGQTAAGEPLDLGKAVQTGPTSQNLWRNPSTEVDTANWSAVAGATISRSAERACVGSYSLKIVADPAQAASGGVQATSALNQAGQRYYACQARVWAQSGSMNVWARITYTDASYTDVGTATLTAKPGWQTWFTFVPSDPLKIVQIVAIHVRTPVAQAATCYVDAIQCEASSMGTPYIDGSLPGHIWDGTAHGSTSQRNHAAHLRYPGVPLSRSGTAMCWARLASAVSLAQSRCLLAHDSGAGNGVILMLRSDNTLSVYCGALQASVAAAGLITQYAWHHYAIAWDEATATTKLYVDGVERASGGWAAPTDDAGGWRVGNLANIYVWPGWLDEVTITNDAKTADEIRAIFESRAPVFAESSAFHFRNAPGVVWADEEGLWVRSLAGDDVLGVYGGAATKVWGSQTLSPNDVLIGRGSAYLLWDDSAPALKIGGSVAVMAANQTYNYEALGAGDVLLGDNSAGKANLLWDQSTGKLLFRGGQVTQVEIGTDGALKSGGSVEQGFVVLDSNGLTLSAGSPMTNASYLKFGIGSTVGQIGAYVKTSPPYYTTMYLDVGLPGQVNINPGVMELSTYSIAGVNTARILIGNDSAPYKVTVGPSLSVTGTLVINGTTLASSENLVEVQDAAATAPKYVSFYEYSATASACGGVNFTKSAGNTWGTEAATPDAGRLGIIRWRGTNAAATPAVATAGYMEFVQEGAAGATYVGSQVRIFLGTNAAAAALKASLDNAGVFDVVGHYEVDGVKVVGNQGAHVANATDAASVIARFNELLTRLEAHGLVAAA